MKTCAMDTTSLNFFRDHIFLLCAVGCYTWIHSHVMLMANVFAVKLTNSRCKPGLWNCHRAQAMLSSISLFWKAWYVLALCSNDCYSGRDVYNQTCYRNDFISDRGVCTWDLGNKWATTSLMEGCAQRNSHSSSCNISSQPLFYVFLFFLYWSFFFQVNQNVLSKDLL